MKIHTYREYVHSAPYPFNVINALKSDLEFTKGPLGINLAGKSVEAKTRWMIDNLPEKERNFMHQCFEDCKSFEEISEMYDTSSQNVRAWYHRSFYFLAAQWRIVFEGRGYKCNVSFLEKNSKLDEHINVMNIPRKTYNVLLRAGIINVEGVVSALNTDPGYLVNQRNFGVKSYEDLLEKLDEFLEAGRLYRDCFSINIIRERSKKYIKEKNNGT